MRVRVRGVYIGGLSYLERVEMRGDIEIEGLPERLGARVVTVFSEDRILQWAGEWKEIGMLKSMREKESKYIDKGELFNSLSGVKEIGEAFSVIQAAPSVDVVEVVRCRECVMWDGSFTLNGQKKCRNMTFCTDGDFYCGWGSKE